MTAPSPRDPERVSRGRLALWVALAALLLAAVYLYFRYAGRTTPLLGLAT